MQDDLVRIPCSSGRNSRISFAKLLTRVAADAQNGFGFEGSLLKPGQLVEWSALWPTPAHPRIPLLLECAGPPRLAHGHRRHDQPDLYILWRFDPVTKVWSELGRAASESWTWAVDLRPLAVRALQESQGAIVEVYSDFPGVMNRIAHLLDVEFGKLPPVEHARAVAVLHDQLCFRFFRSLEP